MVDLSSLKRRDFGVDFFLTPIIITIAHDFNLFHALKTFVFDVGLNSCEEFLNCFHDYVFITLFIKIVVFTSVRMATVSFLAFTSIDGWITTISSRNSTQWALFTYAFAKLRLSSKAACTANSLQLLSGSLIFLQLSEFSFETTRIRYGLLTVEYLSHHSQHIVKSENTYILGKL